MKAITLLLALITNSDQTTIIFAGTVLTLTGITFLYFGFYLIRKEKRLRKIILNETEHLIETIRELCEENERCEMLSSVALNTQNGVIIANADGQVLWVNRAYKQMSGYDPAGLKTNGGTDTLISASCCPDIALYVKEAVRMKQSVRYETCTNDKRGKKLWVSSLITPVFDLAGELKQFVIIDTDITELKQLKEEIGLDYAAVVEIKGLVNP